MKIVNILGGLGNQMFQYAFAIALQNQYPNDVIKLDIGAFTGYPLHNGFELNDIFNLKLQLASKKEVLLLSYPNLHYRLWQFNRHILPTLKSQIRERLSMVYQEDAMNSNGNKYYDGYWQSELYFKKWRPQILEAFQFPPFTKYTNILLKERLEKYTAASIHVRRGDYLKSKYFKDICSITYYKKAISKLKGKDTIDLFLVFSNDPQWCKENLSAEFDDVEVIYIDWNKGKESFRDIQLMSLCKHNIIANSSFSWWGAWLNKHSDKIIIAPSKWKNVPYQLDIIPQDWIKIN